MQSLLKYLEGGGRISSKCPLQWDQKNEYAETEMQFRHLKWETSKLLSQKLHCMKGSSCSCSAVALAVCFLTQVVGLMEHKMEMVLKQ